MIELLNIVKEMQNSKVSNYVIAGLDSYLLSNGNVRLFRNSRDHQDQITPHSHRFNFTCLVLKGFVINKIWEVSEFTGDDFFVSELTYSGEIGRHQTKELSTSKFISRSKQYNQGQTYSMTHDQIHSITFSKGAVVLFFEGPEITKTSLIIEPAVNGQKINTYKKLDYMFLRDKNQ